MELCCLGSHGGGHVVVRTFAAHFALAAWMIAERKAKRVTKRKDDPYER
jgi:hypothetical protein